MFVSKAITHGESGRERRDGRVHLAPVARGLPPTSAQGAPDRYEPFGYALAIPRASGSGARWG